MNTIDFVYPCSSVLKGSEACFLFTFDTSLMSRANKNLMNVVIKEEVVYEPLRTNDFIIEQNSTFCPGSVSTFQSTMYQIFVIQPQAVSSFSVAGLLKIAPGLRWWFSCQPSSPIASSPCRTV